MAGGHRPVTSFKRTLSNSQSTNIPSISIDETEGSRIRIVSETYNLIVVVQTTMPHK